MTATIGMTSFRSSRARERRTAAAGRPVAPHEPVARSSGQDHLVGPDGTLTRLLKSGRLPSIIFWGPPGCGKTTIARLLAHETKLEFEQLSAIFSGVQDLRKAFDRAKARREQGRGTLLFIDEIHRFNRSQQDSFLPHMEDGTITLVGATTENPSFELNAAVLSRASVLTLNRLDDEALEELAGARGSGGGASAAARCGRARGPEVMADGDGRAVINLAEEVFAAVQAGRQAARPRRRWSSSCSGARRSTTRGRDGHYNLISALHKAVRGSDPDAALYWLCRMLDGGEDRLFLARRLVRMAVEDIGLADPQALVRRSPPRKRSIFSAARRASWRWPRPSIYLATAPKSNANYVAYKAAMRAAKEHGSLRRPRIILNAPTKLMEDEGYGDGYLYDHDAAEGFSGQNYFPDEMKRGPVLRSARAWLRARIRKRLALLGRLREASGGE